MRLHAASREGDVRTKRPVLESEARLDQRSVQARVQGGERRGQHRRRDPGDPGRAPCAEGIERERRTVARHGIADRANRRNTLQRNVTQESEREMHVLAGDRTPPRATGDVSRKCQELQPHRVFGHEGEERADTVGAWKWTV